MLPCRRRGAAVLYAGQQTAVYTEKGAYTVDLHELFDKREFVLLDGGMGTMLQERGVKFDPPEMINIVSPEIVADIHRMYVDAGSDIIYSNTFGANRYKLAGCGHSVEEIVSAAVDNAKRVCAGRAYVALDIGPIGRLTGPGGDLSFEEAYDIFSEVVDAGKDADLIVIETMTDLCEMRAALLAAKERSTLPVICTMTFEANGRTFTGTSASAMALTLTAMGADVIGVNCSLGPAELLPIIEEISHWSHLPLTVKANAGLPDPETGRYDVTAEDFAEVAVKFADIGVKVIGGCCGTDPKFIAKIKEKLDGRAFVPRQEELTYGDIIPTAVCSATRTVVIDQPRIIGERINPTGKKRFKEALKANDIGYILSQAIEQANAGADILDVNVGLPDIDEREMMVRVVQALQDVTDLPLQPDR